MNEPPYTKEELVVATAFVLLLNNSLKLDPDPVMYLVMQFLSANDGSRIDQRMAAINEANKNAASPIGVHVAKLPKEIFGQLKAKLEQECPEGEIKLTPPRHHPKTE